MSDNCNNCKTRGVICNRCLHPITSVGIILFRINNATKKRDYLMICRRDSIGYIEYLNGKYNQYNKDYIKTIISEMTCQERSAILNDDIIGLRSRLWGGEFKPFSLNLQSDLKHNELKTGITYNGETYSLESIISEINVVWEDKEWGFPKGRHNNQETDIMCAYREFEEEAGYSRNHINILHNVIPVEEIFIGSNHKAYKHIYYVAHIDYDKSDSHNKWHNSEIGKLEWKPYEDALQSIRGYNIEKRNTLMHVEAMLDMCTIQIK